MYVNHEIVKRQRERPRGFVNGTFKRRTYAITKLRNFEGISKLAPLVLKYFCSRCFLSWGISTEFLMLNICLSMTKSFAFLDKTNVSTNKVFLSFAKL